MRTPPQLTKAAVPLQPQPEAAASPHSAPVPVLMSILDHASQAQSQKVESALAPAQSQDAVALKAEDIEFLAYRDALKEQGELQEKTAAMEKDLRQHQQKVELLEFQLAKIDDDVEGEVRSFCHLLSSS